MRSKLRSVVRLGALVCLFIASMGASLSTALAQSPLPAACKGNNCTIACDGITRIGKVCKDGNNCGAPEIVALAPSSASASPQDNLNFTGIPAGGATINYTIRNPNTPVSTGGTQADPNSGQVSNAVQTFSVAIGGSKTLSQSVATGPTYSQQISVDQIQGFYTLAQYEVTCTPATSGNTTNIRVIKNSLGGNDTFNFTTTNNLAGPTNTFSLNTSPNGSNFVDFAVTGFTGNSAKSFVIDESTLPAGWDFDSLNCNYTTQTQPASTAVVASDTANISIRPNAQLVCTYTNTKKAKVTLRKVTSDGSVATFGFTSSIGTFTNQSITTTGGAGTLGPASVVAGTASTITENDPTGLGYNLTGATCTLDNNAGAPANPVSFNTNTRQLSFTPAAGEEMTCTFTNAPRVRTGSLTIIKVNEGGTVGQTFEATATQVAAPNTATAVNITTNTPQGANFTGQNSINNLVAGAYTVTETGYPAGTTAADYTTTINCVGNNSNGATADVVAGQAAPVCTITNTRKSGLIIQKLTTGGVGTFDFTGPNGAFSITTVAQNAAVSNAASTFTNLAPGQTYSVSEVVPAGWTLQSVTGQGCTQVGNSVQVTPQAGQNLTCTFVNFKKTDDPMDEVTQLFVHRRVDNLLTHGPDRARLLRRLQDGDPPASLKDAGPIKLNSNNPATLESQGFMGLGSTGHIATPQTKIHNGDVYQTNDYAVGQGDRGADYYGMTETAPASNSIFSQIAGQLTTIAGGTSNFKFSTSLSELRQAAADAEQQKQQKLMQEAGLSFAGEGFSNRMQTMRQGWDIWAEGHISKYNEGLGGYDRDGDFRILYVGADYPIAPGVLIGALVQVDDTKEDVANVGLTGEVEGTGWMAGPYIGIKLADNLFFDARAAYGTSDNDIWLNDAVVGFRTGSFETDRWLASATLTGNQYFGNFRLSPQFGLAYGNEWYDDYFTSLGQLVPGHDISIARLNATLEAAYRFDLPDGTMIEPHVSISGLVNFAGGDLEIGGQAVDPNDSRAKVEGGVLVRTPSGYAVRAAASYDGIGQKDFDAYSGSLWINVPLN